MLRSGFEFRCASLDEAERKIAAYRTLASNAPQSRQLSAMRISWPDRRGPLSASTIICA